MTHLKVAVRIRPLSQRETNSHSVSVVDVQDDNVVAVTNLKVPEQNAGDSRERIRRFTFDYCFNENSTQNDVFEVIGNEVERAIKKCYHSCVLAYGQSSSGKTHTMMGNPDDPGLIPRLCRNIFTYLQDNFAGEQCDKIQTVISYLEIYNEKVRDLLVSNEGITNSKSTSLRVREHPRKGPYVQGLTQHSAHDPETLLQWLNVGNTNRRVAATLTNPCSSRSHSVFTISFGQGVQLHLVDLAGSERAGNRFHSISTLKEGANINKSLVALGNVISTLAEQSSKNSRHIRKRFVPYRDSVLTWLLKDTLGGNSKTVMIATVSPSSTCYSETVNTLRFGQRAKKIISRPVVNDDPKERTIRELRAEIARLKQLLAQHQDPSSLPENKKDSANISSNSSIISTNLASSARFHPSEELDDKASSLAFSESKFVTSVLPPFHNESEHLFMKPEKLLPVISVSSDVRFAKKQVPTIRRNSTVKTDNMNTKPKRAFGSQETISSASKDKPKRLSQPTLTRKASIDKSHPPTRSTLLKKTQESTTKKSEKGVITEESGPDKSQPTRRSGPKPRSAIVAAVTDRLYAKTKKRETGTDTEDINSPPEEAPKELSICSNARLRLQELTHKALKAHKRKSVEIQTDRPPVLRVKEISTDVDDLKIVLAEIKDAETDTIKIETKDAAVACFIESFLDNNQDSKHSFVVTRSCGTQSTENLPAENQKPREQPQSSGISFTKYLQGNTEPTYQIVNPCTANPIYTNTVNINVSHNYINRNRLADTVSDDSLEDQNPPNNICFPTPDIISNHNSLEHGNTTISTEPLIPQQPPRILEEKHARSDTTWETFLTGEYFNKTAPSVSVANFSIASKNEERLQSIDFPTVCAPQICITRNWNERCKPFLETIPEALIPDISHIDPLLSAIINEPTVLTPVIKHQECGKEETVDLSTKLPNSLTVNETHKKKVHFSSHESDRMFKAMSKFMEEATNLMTNLSLAASKLQGEHTYDLEVTVNDIKGLPNIATSSTASYQDSVAQTCFLEEASSQTCPNLCSDASSNTEASFQIPVNKYEALVKESCSRLEQCINDVTKRSPCCRRTEEENLHKCSKQLPDDPLWNAGEDYSLESNQTSSDYGSLPRQKQMTRRGPTCSPSAYLRQLTTMRKQIVESSRDELLGEPKHNF